MKVNSKRFETEEYVKRYSKEDRKSYRYFF